MKQIKIKSRMIALLAVVLMSSVALAQTTTLKHIVERGETLETIAEKYGVTKDDIVTLNPDAAQFVYVGMELVVPAKVIEKKERVVKQENAISKIQENTTDRYVPSNDNGIDASEFSHYGVGYRASFEDAGKGCYTLGGTFFSASYPHAWGGDIFIGANYGLVDSDNASFFFILGPEYGYVVNESLILTASLDFVGIWSSSSMEVEKTTKKGNSYNTKESDTHFSWGIALTPRAVFKINKVKPFVGLDFQWSKDAKEITAGFFVGLGFNI